MKIMSFKKFISIFLLITVLFLSLPISSSAAFNQTTDSSLLVSHYETNKIYSGFKLISTKNMPEQNSSIMLFEHERTGARLMFVKNSDNEKVFSISFRTPTTDDTGVNHILEHSVLNGSKNYPVKSPFAEMLKRSLGTFINAMTSSDYTIYPVSSVNEKDLQNLMGIYLDAVFFPNLHSESNIFKQEAWRYHLDSKESKLSINGIVYNEMKGYYSDPSYVLDREIYKSLFPDTSYKWDAGGNPNVIPKLTFEQFKAVHKKYYVPSNSYIYLYGDLDIGKYLEFINNNYLSKMTKVSIDTALKPQKAFTHLIEKVSYYPIPENTNSDRKTYMSLNFSIGNVTDKDLTIGMDYLTYLLMGSDNSPLAKALFNSRIADDFSCNYKPDSLQPVFTITAENSDETSKETFKKIISDVLSKCAQTGFDKDLLKYTFAQYDLKNRTKEISSMKGLTLNFNIMKSWIYDKDPTLYIDTSESVERIKNLSEKKYFESLISKYLLSNKHSSLVILRPSVGLESKNLEECNKELEDYKCNLDSQTINNIIKASKNFKAWQDKADSKKNLATIPSLAFKDIKLELPDLKFKSENISGAKVLSHNVFLNGISSINFYFDTSKVPQEKIHYINLVASLLGNINTQKYKLKNLTNEMLLFSNGIRFSAFASVNSKNPNIYRPVMKASFITINDNIPKSLDLLEEIVNHSIFNNKFLVKQVVQQNKLHMQQKYMSGSGLFSSMKLNAYLSESGRYSEELSGPGYYRFLNQIDKNFDENWKSILKNLNETYSHIFNINELIVSHSGDAKGLSIFKKEIKRVLPKLKDTDILPKRYTFTAPDKNLALQLPVKVQTLIKGGNFSQEGYSYSGKMLVLQRILYMDYLWKSVRTSGGAYGFDVSFSHNGLMSFMSTRDPNLSETLDIFDGAVKYLENFKANEYEMENFKIGAISEFQKMKSMGALYEGELCDKLYLSGLTSDDLIRIIDEVLSTKAKDINGYSDLLEKVIKQNIYYVEGSKEKVYENKDLFKRIDSMQN